MKKKTFVIISVLILALFLTTFFFKTIPVPVENQQGVCIPETENYNPNNCQPERFIYGGIYWTSGLYELSVRNYTGSFGLMGLLIFLFIGNKLFYEINNEKNR